MFDPVLAAIAGNATAKRRQRQMLHDLGKNVMTFVHRVNPGDGDIARSARLSTTIEIETAPKWQVCLLIQNVGVYPVACSMCGAGLAPETSVGHNARQVFDLPEPHPLVVTEHRAHDCQCVACGPKTRASFPECVNAPVQYGPRMGAFVLYLLHYQLLPEKRLAELMADLFGVKLVTATIARISQDCARRFQEFAAVVRDHVAAAPVKHLDETGFRIGGKTNWLHIASTTLLIFYCVCDKRGSLLANVVGIVVHDHWKPYYTMQGVLHALHRVIRLPVV